MDSHYNRVLIMSERDANPKQRKSTYHTAVVLIALGICSNFFFFEKFVDPNCEEIAISLNFVLKSSNFYFCTCLLLLKFHRATTILHTD